MKEVLKMLETIDYMTMIVQGFCVGIGSSIGNYFVLKVLLGGLDDRLEKNKMHKV